MRLRTFQGLAAALSVCCTGQPARHSVRDKARRRPKAAAGPMEQSSRRCRNRTGAYAPNGVPWANGYARTPGS